MPTDFFDALSKRFEGKGIIDQIFTGLSTPQHLVTAAIDPERDFLSSFARGVDPSELAGAEGVGGFALDVVADPLNLLVAAGAVSKLAKGGKLVQAAKAANPIDDLIKRAAADESILRKALGTKLDESVGASALLDEPLYRAHAVIDHEVAAALRGGKFPIRSSLEAITRMPDNEILGVIAKGHKEGVENLSMFERLVYTTGVFKFEKGNMIDDVLKGIQNEDLLRLGGAARRAGQEYRVQREIVDIARTNFARMMRDETDPVRREAIKAMAEAMGLDEKIIKASNMQKFVEYATMAKLTGISTHVRAMIGNSASTLLRYPEKITSGAIDAFLYGAGKGERSVYATEALGEFIGSAKSIKNGLNKAWSMLVSKTAYFEEATKAGEVMFRQGAIGGLKGEIVRFPARIIGAVDVLFKEINRGAELYAQATRMALKEGNRGVDIIKRVQTILENPTDDMLSFAFKSAKERVFQEELTGVVQTLDKMRGKHPASRLIVPFFRTPVNLLKQSLQRTPLAIALPTTRKTLWGDIRKISRGLARGDTRYTKEMLDAAKASQLEHIGRMFSGSLFLSGMTMYAMETGNISALGPKAKSKRSILRMSGWQPQSIKAGNIWISYRGFEPLSSWLRAAGDVAEGLEEGESIINLGPKMVASYAKQFAENPFFMGIHDLYESFSDPEAKADKILAGLVIGSTIPNILQQFGTRVFDPVVREPKGFVERLASRTPLGVSETVAPMRNIFGDVIERDIPIMSAFGFNLSIEKGSKIENEMIRLDMGVGKPSRVINGYEMTDDEYDRFYVLKGVMLKENLNRLVNNRNYDRLSDEVKIKVIRRIIGKTNAFAKAQEFEKYYRSRQ